MAKVIQNSTAERDAKVRAAMEKALQAHGGALKRLADADAGTSGTTRDLHTQARSSGTACSGD
jgi:hypothetical protein